MEIVLKCSLILLAVGPPSTSQVCSRCGALGRRYSIARDKATGKPDIRFSWVEKLFACPSCGYTANADHNASVNLHRRFLLEDAAVRCYRDWSNKSKREQEIEIDAIEAKLRRDLRVMHGLEAPAPFEKG